MKAKNKIELFQITEEILRKVYEVVEKDQYPVHELNLPYPNWFQNAIHKSKIYPNTKYIEEHDINTFALYVETPYGDIKAELNDWIVKGANNEIHPIKPSIYKIGYEWWMKKKSQNQKRRLNETTG